MNCLKPLKFRQDDRSFYGFDIETINKGITFLCGSIWGADNRYFFFTNKRLMIEFLQHKSFSNRIIVGTNTAYDFAGIFVNEPEEMEFEMVMRASRLLSAKSYITPEGFRKRRGDNHRCRKIEFWDTLNFAIDSVEKLGGMLDMKKIEPPSFLGFGKNKEEVSRRPKSAEEWRQLIEYNIRDSEISKRFMDYLKKHLSSIGCPMRMTIASSSMAYFRVNHLNRNYYQPDEDELLKQFEAYYGGRTEVLERGEMTDLHYYDINSLYPAMMAFNQYPDTNTLRRIEGNTQKYIDMFEGYSLVTIECPDTVKLPLLPYRTKDKKLIFPSGKFKGRYTHVELRKAKQLGYIIHYVHECVYYKEVVRPFGFMQNLFEERNRYKKEGNTPMAFIIKLIMNSMYGKFGQRFLEMPVFQPFNLTAEEIEKIQGKFERVGNYYTAKEDTTPASFCVPIWSAYVTAYGRIKIHEYASKYDAVYMDTDSICIRHELPDSKDLGEMKFEKIIKRGVFVKPKFYVIDDGEKTDYKIKGISMKQIVTFAGITTDKAVYSHMKNLIQNPVIEFRRFRKLKESKRSGDPVNEVFKVCKHLDLEDTKRCWEGSFPINGNQKSKPICVDESSP